MVHQGSGLKTLRGHLHCAWAVALIQQLHQRRAQLLRSAPLGLALEGMPLLVADAELLMQRSCQILTAGRPLACAGVSGWTGHWTKPAGWRHPDAMQQRPRSPFQPIRWLHQLANLLTQVSAAERLRAQDDSLQARRLRQRMAAAQRLLDPLPAPLRSQHLQERWLWQFLRWGGVGACVALVLRP
ncbi:MAG: hypothetical protein RLZZ32_1952 [Cyanobacteriota bacterium]